MCAGELEDIVNIKDQDLTAKSCVSPCWEPRGSVLSIKEFELEDCIVYNRSQEIVIQRQK